MAVVRIRESPYYGGFFKKKVCDNFVGTLITVRYKEVSVTRGSTYFPSYLLDCAANDPKVRER